MIWLKSYISDMWHSVIVVVDSIYSEMACNFSQLRRRQSSGSLHKARTEEDFKDQFYRNVKTLNITWWISFFPNTFNIFRELEADQEALESMKEEVQDSRRLNN